ncbi:MAG: hypothetical protein RMJ56_04805 [Gemmataceae bacterium]|nr:hypothetical protein [Gemmata sp.]MDW8196909.1 hypothetical protein [Gemmataceae bacterium]
MFHLARVALVASVAFALTLTAAVGQDRDEPKKGELLKTVISASHEFTKDKKKLTLTAVGQVPTGGWTGAKLTPRKTTTPPKDGIYEFDLTAIRPDGIVTQALSKVTAKYEWENPPADIKGVRIYGAGDGIKTITFDK